MLTEQLCAGCKYDGCKGGPCCSTATQALILSTARLHPPLWQLQLCRQNGLGRWPYRARQALLELRDKMRVSGVTANWAEGACLPACQLPLCPCSHGSTSGMCLAQP